MVRGRTGTSDRPRAERARRAAPLAILFSLSLATGCASRGNVEALEARLRQTHDQLRLSERQLAQTQTDLELAHKEKDLLRQQVTASHSPAASTLPEHTQSLARISGLSINKLMSGGRDRNGDQADDALQLIVAPHDAEGDLVKIAGQMEIEAYDLSKTGDDKRIGRWVFDPGESRKHWHSGFLSSGFQFDLPWEHSPAGKDVLVHARLVTTDGRQFDTNQTITVKPGPLPEPGMIVPPAQVQQVSEARLAPLPTMRRLKKAAQPPEVQTVSVESDVVEVGRAQLDVFESEIPAIQETGQSPWSTPDESVEEMGSILVPDPLDTEAASSPSPWSKQTPVPPAAPVVAPVDAAGTNARPFPKSLSATSDNWTDETIPVLR